jgi:hypothetical protein
MLSIRVLRVLAAALALLSAMSPLAGEALARATGDASWILCSQDTRGELTARDRANLRLLARLSGNPSDPEPAPERPCPDCLLAPPVLPADPAAVPVRPARPLSRIAVAVSDPDAGALFIERGPGPRAPPRSFVTSRTFTL